MFTIIRKSDYEKLEKNYENALIKWRETIDLNERILNHYHCEKLLEENKRLRIDNGILLDMLYEKSEGSSVIDTILHEGTDVNKPRTPSSTESNLCSGVDIE